MRSEFKLEGSVAALVTPFKSNGEIDYNAVEKLIEFQIENGTAGLLVCGTTGETPTLSNDEYTGLISFAYKAVNKRVPIIAGSGSNNTINVIEKSKYALECGADALLIVSPYYNKPMPEGLYLHYSAIAEAVNAPVILYNVPSRTGKNLPASVTLKLANNYDNIVAVKEASGDLGAVMEIIRNRPGGFKIYSGDDALAFSLVVLGGNGCISVAANVIPRQFSQLMQYCLTGNLEHARELQYRYLRLMELNFIESNPIPVKTLLAAMGYIQEEFRLPLSRMTNPDNRNSLLNEARRLELI